MNSDHEKLLEKIRKLLALAERGEGGEAVNARELLDKMLARYGIDEASLTDIRTLRYNTDYDEEKELLIIVASFALQIPTSQVRGEIIAGEDSLGLDLKMSIEQHGLVASLFEVHRIGLESSYKNLAANQGRRKVEIGEEIKKLQARIKVLKSIFENLKKTQEAARNMIVCAYANLNNLVDYTGWSDSTADGAQTINEAAASCEQVDTDIKQLPAQRLGNND